MKAVVSCCDIKKKIFLNDELQKNSNIEKILQEKTPKEKEEIIENIIRNYTKVQAT